jgi:hypothetical protein
MNKCWGLYLNGILLSSLVADEKPESYDFPILCWRSSENYEVKELTK